MSSLGNLRTRVAALAGVIVLLLVAGVWVTLTHASAQSRLTADKTASKTAGKAKPGASPSAQTSSGPLQLVSATPSSNSRGVNGTSDITIKFSVPLAANSPLPFVRPHIAGSWQGAGTSTLRFVPSAGFTQLTHVRVIIPGGSTGVRSGHGALLSKTVRIHYTTGAYQTARLDELLAQLGYLPMTWTPATGATSPAATDAAGQLAAAYSAPQGSYSWDSGYPSRLQSFWQNGAAGSLMLKGAVMAFEANQGMTVDGVPGNQVWSALLQAVASNKQNTHGYTYAVASEGNPERLTVWHNGRVIMKSVANTGIPASPTAIGTAPVYLKYYYQVMKGTNPNGSKYADPVYYVSYFYGGDAVHYFNRATYGWPQSLGCVELPWNSAKFIWKYLTYGTLVTVARGSQTPSGSPPMN